MWLSLICCVYNIQIANFFFSFPFNIIFEIFQLVVMFTNYVANQHLEILKLKFKGEIRVSKTRFVCDGKLMWKKIYVEIEYLKLDFLCGTQVLKTRVPLEHQNRNTKNTRTETQRNNQQIRRNTKEQQIRNNTHNFRFVKPNSRSVELHRN